MPTVMLVYRVSYLDTVFRSYFAVFSDLTWESGPVLENALFFL